MLLLLSRTKEEGGKSKKVQMTFTPSDRETYKFLMT
jgi:hypothetical protein